MKIYQSDYQHKWFETEGYLVNENVPISIMVDSSYKGQMIFGFGAAITEASAYLYASLTEEKKHEFIRALFSKEGLNYSFVRLCIGSSDFSLGEYDYQTEHGFSLAHEEKYLFPLLKDILKVKKVHFFASPWSPPKTMKSNLKRQNGGRLKKECYIEYANYLADYIEQMEKRGFPIEYLTIQNEPEATQTWDSCLFNEQEEGDFILCLYDILKNRDIRIPDLYLWDHNRDVLLRRIDNTMKAHPELINLVSGVAYHWYDSGCSMNIKKVKELYPQFNFLFSEGCIELLLLKDDKKIDLYQNGLRYATNYLEDLQNGSNGFIDWNALLDAKGGPNYVGNYCESPIMISSSQELQYQYSYYMIKHFSFFFENGTQIISSTCYDDDLKVVAMQNKKGIVIVIYNKGKDKLINIQYDQKIYQFKSSSNAVITALIEED